MSELLLACFLLLPDYLRLSFSMSAPCKGRYNVSASPIISLNCSIGNQENPDVEDSLLYRRATMLLAQLETDQADEVIERLIDSSKSEDARLIFEEARRFRTTLGK